MRIEAFNLECILELNTFIKKIKSSTKDYSYKEHLECLSLRLAPKKRKFIHENLELQIYREAMLFYKNNPYLSTIDEKERKDLLNYLIELRVLIKDFVLSEEISKTVFELEQGSKKFDEIGRIDIFYANYLNSTKKDQVAIASGCKEESVLLSFFFRKNPLRIRGNFPIACYKKTY